MTPPRPVRTMSPFFYRFFLHESVPKELFGGWFEFLVGVIVGMCVKYVFRGLLGMKQLTFKWDKCVSFLVVLI